MGISIVEPTSRSVLVRAEPVMASPRYACVAGVGKGAAAGDGMWLESAPPVPLPVLLPLALASAPASPTAAVAAGGLGVVRAPPL